MKSLLKRDLRDYENKENKNKKDEDIQGYESAYLSTDDDSHRDLNTYDRIFKECQSMPLVVKKQLQVIKEDQEDIYISIGRQCWSDGDDDGW